MATGVLKEVNRSTNMSIAKTMVAFEEDDSWLHKQLESEEFQNSYKNKFVAIKDKHVMACAKTVDELIRTLKSNKINLSEIVVEFIYPKGVVILF